MIRFGVAMHVNWVDVALDSRRKEKEMLDFRHRQLGWASAAVLTLGILGLPEAGVTENREMRSPWMNVAPDINGQISAREWSEATYVELEDGVRMWIGNDAGTLYLAILDAVDMSHGGDDRVMIVFDDEGGIAPRLNDDAWENPFCLSAPELGEGIFYIHNQSVSFQEIALQSSCAAQIVSDRMKLSDFVRPEGLTYEMAIPLDGPTALQAAPGESFGIQILPLRDGVVVGCLPGCAGGWVSTGVLNLVLTAGR